MVLDWTLVPCVNLWLLLSRARRKTLRWRLIRANSTAPLPPTRSLEVRVFVSFVSLAFIVIYTSSLLHLIASFVSCCCSCFLFFLFFFVVACACFLLCCLRGMTCSLCPRGRRRRSRAGAHRRCGVRLRRLRRRSCSARAQACCRCGAICASANPLTPRSGCGRFVTDTHARYIRMFNTNECVVVFSRLMRRSCSAPAQACCRSGAICLCICQPVDASFQLRQVHSCMFLIHNTASRTGKDMNLDVTEFPSPTRCLNLSFRL